MTRSEERIDRVCLAHVLDDTLRSNVTDFVSDDEPCGLCGRTPAVDLEQLVEEIEGAIAQRFKPASESSDDWPDVEERGIQYLEEILDVELGLRDAVDADLYDLLLSSLDDVGWVDDPEHEMRLSEQHAAGWAELRRILLRERRYFAMTDLDDDAYRIETIFGTSPREILDQIGVMAETYDLYATLPVGHLLWRGRHDTQRQAAWGAEDLAAAPPDKAAQSRMSPAGISMFYGADTVDTAVAEVDGPTDNWVMVGAFTPVRDLLVLDLTRLPPSPSPFAHDGYRAAEELAFLYRFASEVSAPVRNPHRVHIEYVPTQFVAEYLRVPFRTSAGDQLDGVVYRSSRCAGTCYVVFADHDQCLRPTDSVVDLSARDAGGVRAEFRTRRVEKPQLLRWAGKRVVTREV